MTDTQTKIEKLVKDYIELFPEEYEAFKVGMKAKQKTQETKFAETKGMDMMDRLMFEVPETLHTVFKKYLTDEEWTYYESKKGTRWFARYFAAFRAGEKV